MARDNNPEDTPLREAAAPPDGFTYPASNGATKPFYKTETSYRPISTSDDPSDPAYNPPARTIRRKCHFWSLEYTCLMLSLVAIMGSILLLRRYEGKPIPKWAWAHNGVSFNSLLSLLSAISRGSLMVPLAEGMGQLMWLAYAERERGLHWVDVYSDTIRGPMGALEMIWRRKGWGIECVGALVLLLTLGMGT